MNSAKKTYDFTIAGLPYKLRTFHDSETVRELVQYVDNQMHKAMRTTKSGSFQSAAVLAALNIAEELVLLKRKTQRDLQRLEKKALDIAKDLRTPQKNIHDNKGADSPKSISEEEFFSKVFTPVVAEQNLAHDFEESIEVSIEMVSDPVKVNPATGPTTSL